MRRWEDHNWSSKLSASSNKLFKFLLHETDLPLLFTTQYIVDIYVGLSGQRWQLEFESLMDGDQNTPPITLPDGMGDRATDKQVDKHMRDIYVSRVNGHTKREDKNKGAKTQKTEPFDFRDISRNWNIRVGFREKVWREWEEWRLGVGKTGWWERNRRSVGGKAKQVYVEKRRKQEEEWERKTDMENEGESSIGLNFWSKHTKQTGFCEKTSEMHKVKHQHSNT